jgi:hypothetical protein
VNQCVGFGGDYQAQAGPRTSTETDIFAADVKRFRLLKAVPIAGSPSYLPISICGQKLPAEVAIEPRTVTLGDIDCLSSSPITCSFDVRRTSVTDIDSIFVPKLASTLSTNIYQTADGGWRVVCSLDRNKLALGPLNIDVPVRYKRNDATVVGGINISLNGYVTGDVVCVPRALAFGTVETGKTSECKLQIIPKSQYPLEIGTITSTVSWVHAAPQKAVNGAIELRCNVTPPNRLGLETNSFGGYLNIQLKSPKPQLFRILFYGSIR